LQRNILQNGRIYLISKFWISGLEIREMKTVFSCFSIAAMMVFLPIAAVAQYALINQAGYLPDQVKYVYFIMPDDSFYVVNKTSGEIQYRGAIQMTASKDLATGLATYRGDFSAFTQTGTYQISTPNEDTSYSFSISQTVYESVYKKSLKGFYFQRCGQALLSQNAGVYARSICHTNDGTYHSTTGKTGTAETTGGWHDAGDYGKYIVNAGISVGTLLYAYESFPEKFSHDDLNIPESGNSIPDILDEVRYELEWFLKMQDTTDGGVFFKVTTENFDAFEMPNKDAATRYIYQKSSTATGDFAAVTAQAGRIYKSFDTTFAARCLNASRLAWQYLQANPLIVPTGGFKNPSGTGTGEYGDNTDSDERLWAAAELYVTTGEDTYHFYFKAHYNGQSLFSSSMGWPNVRPLAHIAYIMGKQSNRDLTIQSNLKSALASYCTALCSIIAADGLNVSLLPSGYGWGSNSGALNNAVILIIGSETANNTDFSIAALQQLNYVLGCNRLNMTFITGVGSAYPMYIHHRPSGADGIAEPIPGLIAGGPDKYLDDTVLRSLFNSSTPPARCYADDQGSYASNEICINWNAPLVFVAGYFNESPATSVQKPSVAALPTRFVLYQNYTNPFNPSTVISYDLPGNSFVNLKVFDILGREVIQLVNQWKMAGTHSVTFNASLLPSGVYFYRLQTGIGTMTKKMLLIK